ncbi:adenine DNA glycosylase isoform X2 [Benincasa hispida]|uniref:adenine DNA glycosylase isoform X2 n=1 Tax=Benincasa hispida TaxID=102211 RepID=UPI0019023C98|nr:adenine DNA glycosylase isoform X2 [Benincasa hispida]
MSVSFKLENYHFPPALNPKSSNCCGRLLTSNQGSGSGCCSMSGGVKNEIEEYTKQKTGFRRKKKPTKERKRRGSSPSKREAVVDIEDIMFSVDNVQIIRASLLEWYDRSRRDLPWRRLDKGEPETRAYGVWVSEIMLQQTRVQTVVHYYNRWMIKWPTVQHLSRASLEEVNEMWAGLGYYRRARYLLEGAKMIVKEGGRFPKTVSTLRKIAGIGEYTAGAIASIAFDEVVPVVDGNVIRVIARLKAISGNPKDPKLVKQVWPGDFNQALMELGATLCTPTNPSCSTCPVFDHCEALSISKHDNSILVTDYPAKGIKTKQRHDYSAVCVVEILDNQGTSELEQSSRFLLVKRPDEGLLAGLWEFPSVLLDGEADLNTRRESINSHLSKCFGLELKKNFEIVIREDVGDFIHVFTHIRLKIYVEHLVLCLKGEGSELFLKQEKKSILWRCVDNKAMSSMGLTSSVRKTYAMVEKFQAKKTSSRALPRKKQKA